MATLEEITVRLRIAVRDGSALAKSLKLNMGATGVVLIDGTTVSNEDGPADLTMTISIDDLVLMGKGQLNAMSAVMSGRLRFSDMGLAMTLQSTIVALFSKLN